MTRHSTGQSTQGRGPWILDVQDLDPGDKQTWMFRSHTYRGRKGYFRRFSPMDEVLLKNRDSANDLKLVLNGGYEALVEPNAADSFEDAGATQVELVHASPGGTTVTAADMVLQVAVDSFDADDAARRTAEQHPVERMAKGVLGL